MKLRQTFIWCSQAILIVAGCVLLFTSPEYFPSYYRSKMMGLVAFLYSFGIYLPVLMFRIPRGTSSAFAAEQRAVRGHFQAALSAGFLLGGMGSLGFWSSHIFGIPYDKFVHVAFSALAMVFGTYALGVWHKWSLGKAILVVALIGGVLSVGWEYVEYSSDRWLHFGYFGRLFDGDSMADIVFDLAGIGIGAGIILWYRWSEKRSILGRI